MGIKVKHLNLSAAGLETDDESRTFTGYASKFNGVDSYGDTVIPGAYKNTLKNRVRPVQLRWNHYGEVIGKWLEIKEDDQGLLVKGWLVPGHRQAEDAYALLKHKAIEGLSIGYRVVRGESNENGGLDLHEIDLSEISIVETPADLGAQISDVKKATCLKEIEVYLKNVKGFTRTDAKKLIDRVKILVQKENEEKNEPAEIAAIFQKFKL